MDQAFFEVRKKSSVAEKITLKEGERRIVSILFADIKGFTAMSEKLDAEKVHSILDKILKIFTSSIEKFGGHVDKYEGDLVMALFGAIQASENDTEHAIRAGLEMLENLEKFNQILNQIPQLSHIELGVRIGINTGFVVTGKVGAEREGDYTVYGDSVNLASRMESNAPTNRIMVPEEVMKFAQNSIEFEDHGEIKVKGKTKPISVFLVSGLKEKRTRRWSIKKSTYVGREKELQILAQKFRQIQKAIGRTESEYKPPIFGIKAPAGLGKSRLVYEFLKLQHKKGKDKNISQKGFTPKIAQNPYCVFTSLIRRYFEITPMNSHSQIRAKLENGITELEKFQKESSAKDILDAMPILEHLLGLENDDIRLQSEGEQLQIHIQTAIRHFIEAVSARANQFGSPMVFVLEDLHWLDEASQSTLQFLAKTLNLEAIRNNEPPKQMLFIFTYRDEYQMQDELCSISDFTEISLKPLGKKSSELLIQSMIGEIEIPENVEQILLEKSAGNPFYIEEWITLISEENLLEEQDGKMKLKQTEIPVPNNLNSLILSRIDNLGKDLRLLLQKASVIGREFIHKILFEVESHFFESETDKNLNAQLGNLLGKNIILEISEKAETSYLFKHILTQEVAYNTLLIANRKVLHQLVAEAIEDIFSENLSEYFYDLARHYDLAEVQEKAIYYLKLAGQKAKENFENERALDFFDKLLAYPDGEPNNLKIDALFEKASVLQHIGEWQQAESIFHEVLGLSENLKYEKMIAQTTGAIGWILFSKGQSKEALEYFSQQKNLSKKLDDKDGIAQSTSHSGAVYLDLGDFDKAVKCYEKYIQLCKDLNHQRGIALAIGNLGIIAYKQANLKIAKEYYQKQLEIAEKIRDNFASLLALGNLGVVFEDEGDYQKALECHENQQKISEEIGDRLGVSIAVGNAGIVHASIGNYEKAMECYQKQLEISESLGDQEGIAIAYKYIGDVMKFENKNDEALEFYEKAIEIGDALDLKYYLCEFLFNKAEILTKTKRFEEAKQNIKKSLQIAEEIGRKDLLPKIQVNIAINRELR